MILAAVVLSSRAVAFAPDKDLVVDEVSIGAETSPMGGQEIAVFVEGATDEAVEWQVHVGVSAGWIATPNQGRLAVPASRVAQPVRSLAIEVGPADPGCPPTGLVVDLRFDDPNGVHYSVHERLYFKHSDAGLEVIPFEVYFDQRDAIDAGQSSEDECPLRVNARPIEGAPVPPAAAPAMKDVNRSFSGRIIFWDARGNRSNAPGSRLETCNTTVANCAAGSAHCCWRPVPFAEVRILKLINPQYGNYSSVGTAGTDASGYFSIVIPDQPWSATYRAQVRSRNSEDYGGARVEVRNGQSPFQLWSDPPIATSGTSSVSFGDLAVNAAMDTTSTMGDAFTAFVAATEVFAYLDQEGGETRHHIGGAGWKIYPAASINRAYCSSHSVYVQPAYSRALELVHLLGFQYLGSVVGCAGNDPSYPEYHPGGYDPYTAEGNALRVGIPSLLVTLSRYDPQVASTLSIFSSLYPCRDYHYDNANRASDERNNWHGLWEFVDADTGNTSGVGADYLDLTVKDVLDGVLALKNTSPSSSDWNHTNAEQVLTEVPNSVCWSSEYCSPGDACVGYVCYTGDPHGENVNDVVYRMAAAAGGGWQYLLYGWTLTSSPCMGAADDTYEYTGGFRAD